MGQLSNNDRTKMKAFIAAAILAVAAARPDGGVKHVLHHAPVHHAVHAVHAPVVHHAPVVAHAVHAAPAYAPAPVAYKPAPVAYKPAPAYKAEEYPDEISPYTLTYAV